MVWSVLSRLCPRSAERDPEELNDVKGTLCSLLCTTSVLLSFSMESEDYHLKVVRPRVTNEAGQQYLCVAPYTISDGEKQIVILQTTLHRYQGEKLGHWTWLLVRSEDWKPILERVQMDPNSAAFSILALYLNRSGSELMSKLKSYKSFPLGPLLPGALYGSQADTVMLSHALLCVWQFHTLAVEIANLQANVPAFGGR